MTKLKIKVTKEILERSKMCGWQHGGYKDVPANCAIAVAIKDVFPHARVGSWMISYLDGDDYNSYLPQEAISFISAFDFFNPDERVLMPEIEFELTIPDEVIEKINIEELKPLLENHPTLSLIEN